MLVLYRLLLALTASASISEIVNSYWPLWLLVIVLI